MNLGKMERGVGVFSNSVKKRDMEEVYIFEELEKTLQILKITVTLVFFEILTRAVLMGWVIVELYN